MNIVAVRIVATIQVMPKSPELLSYYLELFSGMVPESRH